MPLKLTNNASSTLASSIAAAGTSLSVQSVDAAKFPALAAGDWFPITVVSAAGVMEIMRVTGRSGATLTVARGQEGTTAAAFGAGARVDLRMTRAALEEFFLGPQIHSATDQAFVDTDVLAARTSSGTLVKRTWANIKSLLKAYFDPLYAAKDHGHSAATTSAAGFMSTGDKSKLDGIASGAQVNPTAAQIKSSYESNSNTNAFTDGEKSKLGGIASGAQVNPTAAQIKSSYESNSNTNAFTDGEKSKLGGIASGATANSSDAQLRARSSHTGTQDINSTTSGVLSVSNGGTGQTSEAAARGIYTGTSANNSNFPIGSYVMVFSGSTNRNSTAAVYIDGNDPGRYTSGQGSNTQLSGTWRARGYVQGASGTLMQRVA